MMFYLLGAIQVDKANSINQMYQIMIISVSKNWNHKYLSHYIIKFVCFMSIYYDINKYIDSSCISFSNLYISIYCKFESIILFFLSKNNGFKLS